MIQINKLVVCEIPKGAEWKKINSLLYVDELPSIQVPSPCEVIGLASEVQSSTAKQLKILTAADWLGSSLDRLMRTHSLTSPASDYLFLKIIK